MPWQLREKIVYFSKHQIFSRKSHDYANRIFLLFKMDKLEFNPNQDGFLFFNGKKNHQMYEHKLLPLLSILKKKNICILETLVIWITRIPYLCIKSLGARRIHLAPGKVPQTCALISWPNRNAAPYVVWNGRSWVTGGRLKSETVSLLSGSL